MDVLARLQPLDILFVVVWAGIVGWGLQTGALRQLGMLIGVYGATVLAGTTYRQIGQAMTLAFGTANRALFEFAAYLAVFALAFTIIGLLIWRAYPLSRLGHRFGPENVVGALLGGIWGVLLLIALLTMIRYFTVVPWREQEVTQLSLLRQVQVSQVAPVLEVVTSPLWQAMAPWFPTQVPATL